MDRYSGYPGPQRARSTDYYHDDLDPDYDRGQGHRASRSYPVSPVKKGRGGHSSYDGDYDYEDEADYPGRNYGGPGRNYGGGYHGNERSRGYQQPSSRQLRRSIDDSDLDYSAADRGRYTESSSRNAVPYDDMIDRYDGQKRRRDEYSADRYEIDRRRDEYRGHKYPGRRQEREDDVGAKRSDYVMSRQDTIDSPKTSPRYNNENEGRRNENDRRGKEGRREFDSPYGEGEARRGRSRDYKEHSHSGASDHRGRRGADHDRYRGRYSDSDSDLGMEPQQDYEQDSPTNRPSSGQGRGHRRSNLDHPPSKGPTRQGTKDPTHHETKGPTQLSDDLFDLPADYLSSSSDTDIDQGDHLKNKHLMCSDKKHYKDNVKHTNDQDNFDPSSSTRPSNQQNIAAPEQGINKSSDGLGDKDKVLFLPTGVLDSVARGGGVDNPGFVGEDGVNMKRLRRIEPIDVEDGVTGRGVASEGRDVASEESGRDVNPGGVVPDITIQSLSSSTSSLGDDISVIDMTSQDGGKVTSLRIDDADSDAASHVTSLAYKRRQSMFPISSGEMLDAIKVKI